MASRAWIPLVACVLLLWAEPASAQDSVAPVSTGVIGGVNELWRLRLPSWLAVEEEGTPEPPVVRAEAGVILWPFLRTSIQLGEPGGDPGTEINDAESKLGLPREGVSPFAEISVGKTIRFGMDVLDIERSERLRTVYEMVDAKGVILAQPGGMIGTRFDYLQTSAYLEVELLRGASYRIALLAGARYLRVSTRLRGLQSDGNVIAVTSQSDVFSPFFGGTVELHPVPVFSVFASIRFIDWSWAAIHLREQNTFTSRLGCAVSFLDGLLGLALDLRFLSSQLDTGSSGATRGTFALQGLGVGLTGMLRF